MKKLVSFEAKELGFGTSAAEGGVADDTGRKVFVTVYLSDVEAYSVSEKSALAFLAGEAGEPAELSEEYSTLRTAKKNSEYGEVFAELKKAAEVAGMAV